VLRANKTGRNVFYEIQFDVLAETLRGIAEALERARDDFTGTGSCALTTTKLGVADASCTPQMGED
jgi:ArsR family transcriptional regulator